MLSFVRGQIVLHFAIKQDPNPINTGPNHSDQ